MNFQIFDALGINTNEKITRENEVILFETLKSYEGQIVYDDIVMEIVNYYCDYKPATRENGYRPSYGGLISLAVKSLVKGKYTKEDVYQDAHSALNDAVRKYDPSRNIAFSTYAVNAIRNNVNKKANSFNKFDYNNDEGYSVSMNSPIGDDEDELSDFVPDSECENINTKINRLSVNQAVEMLDEMKKEAIKLKYWESYSIQMVGDVLFASIPNPNTRKTNAERLLNEAQRELNELIGVHLS